VTRRDGRRGRYAIEIYAMAVHRHRVAFRRYHPLTGGAVTSGLAVSQDTVFAGSADGNLYALQA
jgi:outer membrane protein assembly factor BamB